MARPHKPRIVCQGPAAQYFKPRGIPLSKLEEIVLGLDELEALRLADFEGLCQAAVGERMGVSRCTVGRLLERARRSVADALLHGKALRLEGGPIAMTAPADAVCPCGKTPETCPRRPGAPDAAEASSAPCQRCQARATQPPRRRPRS